jgi:transposase
VFSSFCHVAHPPPAPLRRWVVQAQVDGGIRPGVTTAEAEEIRRLKAEVKRLREANEILKAASIFFAGELDSRNR